jgi:hypothetical protein
MAKPNVSIDSNLFIDRNQVGYAPGATNPKANFAFDVTVDGSQYTFIPDSTIQKGVTVDYNEVKDPKFNFSVSKEQFYFPWFANNENQITLGQIGKKINLSGTPIASELKNSNASESGILVPRDAIDFSSTIRYLDLTAGEKPITALGTYNGEGAYKQDDKSFLGADGSQMTVGETTKGGGGIFGSGIGPDIGWVNFRDGLQAAGVVVGNYFVPGSSLVTSQLVTKGAQEDLSTDVGRVANLAAGLAGAGAFDSAAAGPELLGEAGGNTFALEAGSEGVIPLGDAAAGGAVATPVYSPDLPVGTPLPPLTEPTLDEIIAELAPPATVVPPVEVGPELLGEAGGNTFPLEPTQEGLIPLGDAITPVSNAVYDYGDATPAEITSAKAAMASQGLTFKDALNYVRAGLLVNAITGDPLGLSGGTGGGGGSSGGFTGFEQVPIPAEWRSPTYAASSSPIDLNTLFTNMNLLGGTQWQGLPTQKPNMSFNDIFAAGQQQTPMGTPVDINQIVSSILGQNTASQKSA